MWAGGLAAQPAGILPLRSLYHRSYGNKKAAQQLYDATRSVTTTPLHSGYRAIAAIMMCNHVFNPYTKLKYFNSGRRELDAAIVAAPSVPELRYLRFAVQCNAPALLGYNDAMEEDRTLIINWLTTKPVADTNLHRLVYDYMSTCPSVPDTDKQRLRALYR